MFMAKGSLLTTKSKTGFQSFVLRNEPRPGCSSDLDQDALRELVEYNLHKSRWESALDLNTSQTTICHHLKKIGKVSKLGILVKENHISIATSFLSRQRNDLFLKNIITGDEKWIFYDNVQCKRQWIDKAESLQPAPKVEKS